MVRKTSLAAIAIILLVGLVLFKRQHATESPPVVLPPPPELDAIQSPEVVQGDAPAVKPLGGVQKPSQPLTVSPENPDAAIQQQIQQYLDGLAAQGLAKTAQGVWMQSGDALLANHQGTIPLPAASVTKVATTLAALQTFGPNHQFLTVLGTTGPVQNGVLQGDLVVQGGEDPFFVWEEAVALGNQLNQLGIQQVSGNLLIIGKFYMNFESAAQPAGDLLKQGLNAQIWPAAAENQYQTLPPGTPRPQVAIAGSVQVLPEVPEAFQPIVRHYSLPLAELLKKMNQYSNNKMAEMLANAVGGATTVAQKAAAATGVPPAEISLINGSGLGVENRISPRAATAMFLAIERYLKPYKMTIADVFTVVGNDEGILKSRSLPQLAILKSGSLNSVSALAGVLPTQQQGTIWLAIMNAGGDLQGFRTQQEALLQNFVNQWGGVSTLPAELVSSPERKHKTSRSEIVQ
ncbi:MAG: D-alanyl-D-alanine carboxypeptidase [Cyanothece sp. SIO1E1]|nr:D-alanyl-D-alanine carboxypeptidase [Cyanothece sp. SIO1E1]